MIEYDLLNPILTKLDQLLLDKYYTVTYRKPWKSVLKLNNMIKIYIRFPSKDQIEKEIYEEIIHQVRLKTLKLHQRFPPHKWVPGAGSINQNC